MEAACGRGSAPSARQSVNEANARNAKIAHLVLVGDPRRRIVKVARRRVDAAAVRLEAAEMLVV